MHLAVTIALIVLQFIVPKKWAFLPLLIAALHTSQAQVIPSFSTARLVIIAGLLRATISGDFKWSPKNPTDLLIALWGIVALTTSFFHTPTETYPNPVITRTRVIIDIVGTFLYAKAFIQSVDDFKRLAVASAYAAIRLAGGMLLTQLTMENIYSLVGASPNTLVRNGTIRAVGPFGTPILAGTVGAIQLPLFVMIWREKKIAAKIGVACSMTIIFTSGSSTPIGALIIGIFGISMWRYRHHLKTIIIWSIVALFVMNLFKERPIWYLIAITDFVGGSTGWHRAYLIDMAIEHTSEWWRFGTEFTRHWMPYGLPAIPEHCDLTNYYIHMGVLGGMPLMLIIILIIRSGFKTLSPLIRAARIQNRSLEFTLWCAGALLFTHSITFLTISYFDQTYILFYFLIGFLSNLQRLGTSKETLK